MNSYWAGVLVGACLSSGFFTVMMFTTIQQNNELKTQIREEIKAVEAKVAEHDEIMQAYAFYNWKMSFQDEEELK